QIFRPHAVEWRETAAQDVIYTAKLARPLDRTDVRRLLDHAQKRLIAPRVAADRAHGVLGEIEATIARTDAIAQRQQRFSETPALFLRLLQQVIRQPQRG